MSCQRCGSDRVLSAGGKSSDCNTYTLGSVEREGYNIRIDNLGGGDYWSIDVCLECGQAQGEWPTPTPDELLPSVGRERLTADEARLRFPGALERLEEETSCPFTMDQWDVLFVHTDGRLVLGNTLDDLWDSWNGVSWEEDDRFYDKED